MSYGSKRWEPWVFEEAESIALLKSAYDRGINTWDTADVYSNGVSETIVAKAIKEYGIPREKLVIMTKCFYPLNDDPYGDRLFYMNPKDFDVPTYVNQHGLSRKHIFEAVEASLKRLESDYIDVLQIHRYDPNTPPEETMCALNDLIKMGKIRYIGASSMWTYQFLHLQHVAEKNGWTKFISMQNYHNLLYREEEREMIPACKMYGVGLIPWSPIARGALARPYEQRDSLRASTDRALHGFVFNLERESDKNIIASVEQVAKSLGKTMAQVALAWSLRSVDAPIVGLNSIARMDEMVEALSIDLTDEEVKLLEEHYIPRGIQGALS